MNAINPISLSFIPSSKELPPCWGKSHQYSLSWALCCCFPLQGRGWDASRSLGKAALCVPYVISAGGLCALSLLLHSTKRIRMVLFSPSGAQGAGGSAWNQFSWSWALQGGFLLPSGKLGINLLGLERGIPIQDSDFTVGVFSLGIPSKYVWSPCGLITACGAVSNSATWLCDSAGICWWWRHPKRGTAD